MRGSNRPYRLLPGCESLEHRLLMAVSYNLYPLAPAAFANSITVGPDKNLWFAIAASNGMNVGPPQAAEIGVINPSNGLIGEYPTPNASSLPHSIVSGPGGNLWFLDQFNNQSYASNIGSINPTTHAIVEYPVGIAGATPVDLAVGADGRLWFTDYANAAIGVFNPTTHTANEYPLPNTSDRPSQITAGPDGNLWFIVQTPSGGAIGDINPTTLAINLTALPSPSKYAFAITAGPDQQVWFTDQEASYVGTSSFGANVASINTTTHVIGEHPVVDRAGGITTGPDGNLWFVGDGRLGNINPTTLVTSSFPSRINGGAIVTGPDGNLWIGASGTVASAHILPANQAVISGSVVFDSGGNTGFTLPGQTVFLDLKGDAVLAPNDPTASADSTGFYSFDGIAPGTYTVRVVPYPGNVAISPTGGVQTVTVSGGQAVSLGPLGILPTTSLLPLAFNPSPFGTKNPDVQTADVTGLYNLILGRSPDAAGGASAVAFLKNGGSVGQLAADLLTSAEYDTRLVASYYESYLARSPDAAGGAAAVAYLQGGGTPNGLAASLLGSAEFNALFPANASFAQALYGDLLGRLSSSGEVSAVVGAMNAGMTRPQLIASYIHTPEADIRAVQGLYGIILARATDPVDQAAAVHALQLGETPIQLATGLLGSAEFVVRANATVG